MKKKKVNKRKIDPKVLAITGIIKEEILDLKEYMNNNLTKDYEDIEKKNKKK